MRAVKSWSSSSMRRAAGGGFGALDQALDGVGALVEELDVKVDARHGIDAGLGDLLGLFVGQRIALFLLRGEWRGEQEAEQDGSESAHGGIPPALLF